MSEEDCFHLGAKALIRNPAGELLLLTEKDKSYWDIPGGRIKKGEALEDALKREVYEETGIQTVTIIQPFLMVLMNVRIPVQNSDVGLIVATYLCEVSDNILPRLSEEHSDFKWVDPMKAAQLLSPSCSPELTKKIAQLASLSSKPTATIPK